jgi:hypothetical protein
MVALQLIKFIMYVGYAVKVFKKRNVNLLNTHQPARISQIVPTQYYGQGGDIPGVGQVTPLYPEAQNTFQPAVVKPESNNLLSGLSGFNFKDIKGFVDRMGGIEGVMSTLTKVQKTMQTFKQMAPMLKLLIPKLSGAESASLDDDDAYYRRRRRRRRGRNNRRKGSSIPSSSYSRGRARQSISKGKSRRRKY